MANLITKELYPIAAKNLAKKENQILIKKSIGQYLDKYSEKLTKSGPVHRTIFLESDREPLYTAIGLSPLQIKEVLQKSPDINNNGANIGEAYNMACALAVRYFAETNNKDMMSVVIVCLTLSMYPSLHKKYYRVAEPNEQIMNYTINNLSNKYIVKQKGNLFESLVYTSSNTYKVHKTRLAQGNDISYAKFVLDVKTRLNSLMRKISNEFYINQKEKHYLNSDGDSNDPDNYYEADSNTYGINRVVDNVVLKLTVSGPDIRLVNIAAQYCKVSKSALRNHVQTMVVSKNREDIREIAESILFLFIFDSQNNLQDIGSTKFLMYSLDVYKKSNTTDKNVIKIKKILDKWLEELGVYKQTERAATINDFRRALFIFFVISIQKSV